MKKQFEVILGVEINNKVIVSHHFFDTIDKAELFIENKVALNDNARFCSLYKNNLLCYDVL